MKKIILQLSGATVLSMAFLTANVAFAQMDTTTTTTQSTSSVGTVSAFSPDAITITSRTSATPLHYTFTKTTSYVDENGNPVSVETVKSGAPVTVFYTQNGDQMVASKVMVKKTTMTDDATGLTSSQQTTTTTTRGTVSQFGPDAFSVQTDSSPSPVSYSFTKTTTYVDENGNPVSVETVKSGSPVTVSYTRDGDRMVATRVVVHSAAPTQPDGQVIDQKKTTTTTTTTPNP